MHNVAMDDQAASSLLFAALFLILLFRPRRRGEGGDRRPPLFGAAHGRGRAVANARAGRGSAFAARVRWHRLRPLAWAAASVALLGLAVGLAATPASASS